jgi:hypothetical protein
MLVLHPHMLIMLLQYSEYFVHLRTALEVFYRASHKDKRDCEHSLGTLCSYRIPQS